MTYIKTDSLPIKSNQNNEPRQHYETLLNLIYDGLLSLDSGGLVFSLLNRSWKPLGGQSLLKAKQIKAPYSYSHFLKYTYNYEN